MSKFPKTCFSTLPCPQCSMKELRALCDKFLIDGVEIRLEDDAVIQSVTDGVNVVSFGTGVCLLGYEEEKIKRAKNILDKIKNTEVKAIRLFLGNFAVMKDTPRADLSYDGIVLALKELCDYTKKEIWIETHNEFATGKVLSKLLLAVQRKNLKIIWDVIHPIEDGETPQETWDYIGKSIAHVHFKDGKKSDNPLKHDYDYTLLGEGELPLDEILKLLEKEGFDGFISLEWENRWREELRVYTDDIEYILQMFKAFLSKGE